MFQSIDWSHIYESTYMTLHIHLLLLPPNQALDLRGITPGAVRELRRSFLASSIAIISALRRLYAVAR
jgi:hypothetical protein